MKDQAKLDTGNRGDADAFPRAHRITDDDDRVRAGRQHDGGGGNQKSGEDGNFYGHDELEVEDAKPIVKPANRFTPSIDSLPQFVTLPNQNSVNQYGEVT